MLRPVSSGSSLVVLLMLVTVGAVANLVACLDSVDRASEKNAATAQSHEEQDARLRAKVDDGGILKPLVGADNYDLASDASRR